MIQPKIDLFAAGFEYNAIVKIDHDESRKALLRFKSSMDSLCPIEERAVDDPLWSHGCSMKTVGGIHAVVGGGSAQLFALGSASRGIPYKQWEIPLPVVGPFGYGFFPHADVFAVVELQHAVTYVLW